MIARAVTCRLDMMPDGIAIGPGKEALLYHQPVYGKPRGSELELREHLAASWSACPRGRA